MATAIRSQTSTDNSSGALRHFGASALCAVGILVLGAATAHATSVVTNQVASLARHLDVEVVAEGIETAETLARLRVLGCQYGQGHYFAQSMSADLLPLWMSTRPPVAETMPTAALRRRLLRPAL